MGDVTKQVLQPLLTMYGEPVSDNIDGVYDLYEKVLGGYSDEVLSEALAKVIGDFFPGKRFPWPAPSLIKRAANLEVAKTAKPISTWPADIDAPIPERTPEERERVARMMEDFRAGIASKTLGNFDPKKVARSKELADRIIGERDE